MPATMPPASSPLLRFALLGDAVAGGATGLLMAAAAGPLRLNADPLAFARGGQ